jgi:hypothetical protein
VHDSLSFVGVVQAHRAHRIAAKPVSGSPAGPRGARSVPGVLGRASASARHL